MKFMKFDEYLNSKGKVESKPETRLDGDCIDPSTMPNTPPSGGKPYAAKNEKAKKSEKALGDQGDEELKYEPVVDNNNKGKAPAKIPTVEQAGLVTLMAKAIKENPLVVESLVRTLKHEGLLGFVVAESLNHRDTYKHISQIMAHESYGPDVCNKLARAMNEETAAPFSDQLDLDDEEDVEDTGMESPESEDDVSGDEEDSLEPEMGSNSDGEIDAEVEPELGDDENEEEPMGPLSPEMFKDHPAVKNLQKALMRSYMRRMMDQM
jgi:hypothetical protein